MSLTPHSHDGLTLLLHNGPTRAAEIDILAEVQREYPWDFPIRTAIDIGAHIGAWTCTVFHRFPDACVVAVEVDPDNYALLEQNTAHLPVHRHLARAGYSPGLHGLLRAVRNSGSTACYRIGANWSDDTHVLAPPAVTLEQLITGANFATVDVLKLDCEGSEIDILLHADPDTLMRIGRIIGEIHTTPSEFESQINYRLQRLGFAVTYRPHPGDPTLFYIHAWRDGLTFTASA